MSDHQHERRLGEQHPVTPLELFFDLVFVFALTQVTALMADDPTWEGLGRGFAVLAAVWWAWAGYSWLTNTVRIDDDFASRLVMFAVMAAMLVVGLAAPEAFGSAGILFGAAFLVVRLLHIALYAVTTRGDPDVFRAVLRLAPGMVVSPLLILAAGFLDAGPGRAALWIVALTVDYGSPLLSGTEGWKMDAAHFAERHGLVVIIALGESLVALGLGAAGQELTAGVVAAATLGVVVVCAMWWLYFDVVAVAAERRLSSLTGRKQAALARDSYSYLHLFLIFGIVLVALGLKKTLLHIDEPLDIIPAVALFGGLALYLAAHIAFRWRNIRTINEARLVTAAVLVALLPVGVRVPALVSLALAAAALVGLVTFEAVRWGDTRHQIRQHDREPT